jgi:8-oxo-dGTP diphosphatase
MKNPQTAYWGFPKGHIEKGESSQQAAIREVKEETNLEVEVIEKIGDSKYVFTASGEKIFKVVIMFLMKYQSGEIKYQQSELLEAKWVPEELVLETLSFSNDKSLFKLAMDKIKI